jgi:hypothetical protein
LFFAGGIAVLLRALGFNSLSNGVMRILTDPLNSHIEKIAKAQDIPIHWWPSVDGGTDGAKQKYVQEKYATEYTGKDNHVYQTSFQPGLLQGREQWDCLSFGCAK